MKFPHFFIDRPIFAAVCSVLVLVAGVISYPLLPVGQYPEIAPPTVTVTASFPGATAETMAQTVAQPLEEEINGVEGMIYMSSSAMSDGTLTITCTFKLGTDVNAAQVLVENRVAEAEPRLPEETRSLGVSVRKSAPDILLVFGFSSPDHSLNMQYIANYVTLQLNDRIKRVPGVGDTATIGGRDYSMRIWIDPDLAASRDLTVDEIVTAVRNQNAQVSSGAVGSPPFGVHGSAYQMNVEVQSRLVTPEQFGDVVLKRRDDGGLTRLRDVAHVELGAEDYTTAAIVGGADTDALIVRQLPGSNALETAAAVKAVMAEASKKFPRGMAYTIPYHPTDYISDSIREVQQTLLEALALVALVVLLFLQSWRAAVIPLIAIPISVLGSFAFLKAFGFSLNNLSMFGLVLAIGIVVDDAIVVIENVERIMAEEGLSPRAAAHKTMDEVSGALVAILLVLCGVFIPTAFIPGISGKFYMQFALTVVSATMISAFVSLTLSPAMAALLLKPSRGAKVIRKGPLGWVTRFARGFNGGFEGLSRRYGRLTGRLVRTLGLVGAVYVVLILLAGWRFTATPTGFIPMQDQGYLITALQMPPGTAIRRTDAVARKIVALAEGMKETSVTVAFSGFDGATFTNQPNAATVFVNMKPLRDRKISANAFADKLRAALGQIHEGHVLVIPPPPVQGIGTGGGWKMEIEDRSGTDNYAGLARVTSQLATAANADPTEKSVFTTFNVASPRVRAVVDRERAEQIGVAVPDVFSTLSSYLGSAYINDFNYLGRTWRVTAQADARFRQSVGSIDRLRTRSKSGAMVPLGSVLHLINDSGPYRVVRYNLYPSAELQGEAGAGFSSSQAMDRMKVLAAKFLPEGMSYEWTDLSYQQAQAGNTGTLIFGLAVLFVFLLLAAQYESLLLPLAVVLIVPMCLLAAIIGVNLMGLDNNILTQIGLVVLVGLAAKNAILIIEFARQGEASGLDKRAAAEQAAHQRLRPILMTSIAFIFGVLPLVVVKGPGSEMRQSLGVAVFFGMIGVTFFGLMFTPSFYVITRSVGERIAARRARRKVRHPADEAQVVETPS